MQYSSVGTSALLGLAGGSSKHKRGEESSSNSFAQLLSQYQGAANTTQAAGASSDVENSTTSPAEAYQESLKLLRDKIDRILSKLEIESTPGESLGVQLNANGELVVTGNHPRLQDLQAALNSDPGLRDLFIQVARQAEEIAKAENPDGISAIMPPASYDEPTTRINLPERFSLQIEGTQIKPQLI